MSSEPDINTQMGNVTHDMQHPHYSSYPSVWSLIRGRIDSMVSQAVRRADTHFAYTSTMLENFKRRIESLLEDPLEHVAAGHPMGMGNHTIINARDGSVISVVDEIMDNISKEVEGAINQAVDGAMVELNETDVVSNTSLVFKESFVHALDTEIEMDVFNKVFTNATHFMDDSQQDTDFFHKLPMKDETMFVALVCMGIIVPIIFITLLIIFFYKKRRDNAERRQEMLLRDQPEFSMDEYTKSGGRNEEEDVPDLDLRMMKV